MNKMIVEVKCPATSKSYDFRISKKLSAAEGKEKILDEIRTFESNSGLMPQDVSLFCAGTGKILNGELTFSENGVKSGDTLMII